MRNITTKTSKPAAPRRPATKRGGVSGGKPKTTKHKSTAAARNHHHHQQAGLKVVHISNPMRVEASPAEFRSLVQELTGRNAVEWPDHPRWRNSSSFFRENISNDQRVPPLGGGGTLEAEVEDELHPGDFGLDELEFGFGITQPIFSSCFGSDHSYDLFSMEEEFLMQV